MATPGLPGWQTQILRGVGAPVTPQNLLFVNDWAKAEGGGAANNPFNTTEPGYGATGNYNSVGVKDYATPQQGVQATLATLQNGRYGNILSALKQGTNARSAAQALAASPWGTGALVLKMLGGAGAEPPAAPSVGVGAGAGSVAGSLAPQTAQPVRPQVDYQPRLASLLEAASGGGGDYSQFYATLKNALQARQQPQQPVRPQQAPPLQPSAVQQPQQAAPANLAALIHGNTQGEQGTFLQRLAQLAQFEHAPVDINSGYRSLAEQQQLYANRASNPNPVAAPGHSLHEQGLAADGTVGGVPLGRLPAALLARFGLATVPGDPVHIQIAGGR